jgi:hypothetical protein
VVGGLTGVVVVGSGCSSVCALQQSSKGITE